ncbi:hypothetical protein JM93_03224 [Roseibium hamelinense]|uniref:Uncharacterized protein n=1 Tax=Roseibium hamelinense TaxID=150831 RepID=A0A562SPV9_9HYPH|nr:hypothetical protein JM93_03224 [Roseibium hamelinense]
MRQGHAKALRELKSEIDFIAAKIKILIDRDDKESKEEMKKAMSDLDDGMQALREFEAAAGSEGQSGGSGEVSSVSIGTAEGIDPALFPVDTAVPVSTNTATVSVQPQLIV